MANTKISDFTSGSPAQSTDEFVIARSGANFKLAGSDIKTLAVGSGSVSVASGKTLTANNTLTLAGTDATTMTFPSTSATLARTDAAQTFTGSQTVNGGTITADAPVLNMSQTWNASGVTFTGLRFNAAGSSHANSAAGSLLMDLQVGGSSNLQVSKGGLVRARATAGGFGLIGSNSKIAGWGVDDFAFYNSSGISVFAMSNPSGALWLGSDKTLCWGTNVNGGGGTADTILTRRAAANLRLGAADAAAPVAQTLSVQSVVAGTTNTAGANLTITGSQGTGTGAGGSIIFQVAPAGSSGTVQNALVDALTISGGALFQTTNPFAISNTVTTLRSFSAGSGGGIVFSNSATNSEVGIVAGNTLQFTVGGNGVTYVGQLSIGVLGGFRPTADTILARDAANTLALRNANNGQTFRVYGRYTSATDHERFFISAPTTSGDTVLVGTDKGSGGGAARALAFQTDGTTRLTIATNGDLTIADAENIILGTTTGTKIGTATSQKIGFFNATPVVQPTAVADATDNATAITQLNALLSRMRDLGLIAT